MRKTKMKQNSKKTIGVAYCSNLCDICEMVHSSSLWNNLSLIILNSDLIIHTL